MIDGIVTKAQIVPGSTPRTFAVAITNGSGVKRAEITANSFDGAQGWAQGWAHALSRQTGEAWNALPVGRANGRETGIGFGPSYDGKHRA